MTSNQRANLLDLARNHGDAVCHTDTKNSDQHAAAAEMIARAAAITALAQQVLDSYK